MVRFDSPQVPFPYLVCLQLPFPFPAFTAIRVQR